tara:strand:+ start:72 stop:692 length:621 start_codon:yes stop_codon:yes gene_type:complete
MKKTEIQTKFKIRLSKQEYESLKDVGDNYLHKKIDEIRADQIEPSEILKKELYRLHKEVVQSPILSFNKKERLLNLIFAYEPWSWRVVGISREAINEFKKNDYQKITSGGPQRDHFFKMRKDYIRPMMKTVMPYDDWWNLFWEGDRTIIVTKNEHKKHLITKQNFNDKIIDVDHKLGFFRSNQLVGFSFDKMYEGEYLKNLINSSK